MSHTEATCGSRWRNIWANILVLAPGLGDFLLTDSPLGVSASWCGRKYHLHGWLGVKLIHLLPRSSLKSKGHLVNAPFSSDQPGEERQLGRHSFLRASGTTINCLLQKVLIGIIQNGSMLIWRNSIGSPRAFWPENSSTGKGTKVGSSCVRYLLLESSWDTVQSFSLDITIINT